MGKFGFILLLFFFFLFPGLLAGQENYAVKTFNTDQGLPHNNVRGIAQDHNGFLWIATWDGLSRWDGYEFRNYYHNPTDTTTIAYFQVEDVVVDYQNNVWVNALLEISKYNRKDDSFSQFRVGRIGKVALDKEGKLWVNSQNGLHRWNYQTNKFELVQVKMDEKLQKINNVHPQYIRFDNENRLCFFGIDYDWSYFYRCSKIGNAGFKAEFIGVLDNQKYFPSFTNYSTKLEFLISADNNLWIIGNTGTYRLDRNLGQFLPYPEFDAEKDLSGLSSEEIKKVKEFQACSKPLINEKETHTKAKPDQIESYLVDRQNTFWQGILSAGSLSTGLTRSMPTPKGFKHYFLDQNPENGLNAIFPVLKDRYGTVWAGPTNVNQFFRMDKSGHSDQVVPIDQATLKTSLRPRSILEDSTGIWIGYFSDLLLKYNFNERQFSKEIFNTTRIQDRSLPREFVHLKKEGNELYIFGFKTIFKYNIKTRKAQQLVCLGLEAPFNFYSVTKENGNGWWVGGSKSTIIHYDDSFTELGRYYIGSGDFNIESIVAGEKNDLWISQLGGGLARFDKATGKSEIFTTADGLSNNTCYGILKDSKGNLWISTNHGISRFDPKTQQFRTFGPSDGLKIDEFNSDATFQATDGEMYFGGMGGVVSFYPDSVGEFENTKPEPIHITDFKVSGTPRYFRKAVYELDTVRLNKGDNNFQVSFACLDFRNADKVKYRYRLSGESREFVVTDHRHRSVNYSSLIPGEYRLEIEATNRNGEWVSKTALLIVIPALYYQTVWFRFLLSLLILLLVGYLIYSYNRQIVLKARKQQEELRLESLRGQMNPHFIFNSLNSINYFISQNDRLSANRYIADFSRLIRTILGNTTRDYIPLAKELESLHDYLKLEHLRFGDKFDYSVQVSEELYPEEISVFPGMVQPFIENAIWHGMRGLENRKGEMKIKFSSGSAGCLICVVEDDGIGRKRSEKCKSSLPGKTSRGIGIVLERLKIINNLRKTNFKVSIEDVSPDRDETGTRVTIDIPVHLTTSNRL
jgi:streptogramin lyase